MSNAWRRIYVELPLALSPDLSDCGVVVGFLHLFHISDHIRTRHASLVTRQASTLRTRQASVVMTRHASTLSARHASILPTRQASVLSTRHASVLAIIMGCKCAYDLLDNIRHIGTRIMCTRFFNQLLDYVQ